MTTGSLARWSRILLQFRWKSGPIQFTSLAKPNIYLLFRSSPSIHSLCIDHTCDRCDGASTRDEDCRPANLTTRQKSRIAILV